MSSSKIDILDRPKTGYFFDKNFRIVLPVIFCLILNLFAVGVLYSQELRNYYITCSEIEFQNMISNPLQIINIDCSFEYNAITFEDAKLCLREGKYRYFPKKSFKIDLDDENQFDGRDKLNLMAEWDDATFSREYLAYDSFRRAGLVAPQTCFARLYVNDLYIGLYLDVEEIDSFFLQNTSLSDFASVYQADTSGCLLTVEENIEELWTKSTNETTGYYDLQNLIELLENTAESQFFAAISQLFDIDQLTAAIALNSLLGNYTTYYDNYILIHELEPEGIWSYVPWDPDSTFYYWDEFDEPQYYRCGHQSLMQINPLTKRCWRNSEIRGMILDHMVYLADTLFTTDYFQQITGELAALLHDAVEEDTSKQYSTENFMTDIQQIPSDAGNRRDNILDRIEDQPLPFDLHPAFLTPGGVYFAWDSTFIQNSNTVTYIIEISDNIQFIGNVGTIGVNTNTSLLYDNIQPGQHYWRVKAYSPANEEVNSLCFYNAIYVPENAFAGTVVSENITGTEVWDLDGSPYSLTQGLIIEQTGSLEIDPGVLVGIGAGESIIVRGTLNAVGTEQDSIRFVPLDPDHSWGGILGDTTDQETNLGYVSMHHGSYTPVGAMDYALLGFFSGDLNVFDSYFSWLDWGGIFAMGADVHIERVVFEHFNLSGILVQTQSIIMRDCKFTHGSFNPEYSGLMELNFTDESSEISRCEFIGCGDDAIDFDDVQNVTVSNNYITGCLDKAISITGVNNIEIFNNVFTNNNIGLGIKTNCSAEMFNNIVVNNNIGLDIIPSGYIGASVDVHNSVIWGNQVDVIPDPNFELNVDYSLIGGPGYPGQGNLNADPQFIDPWNENFYPLLSSPLIDAGFGTGHPPLDFIDSSRIDIPQIPNTGAGEIDYVDIGIYEFYDLSVNVHKAGGDPESYSHIWNYPNPFNNITKINFEINHSGGIEIVIYNLLGQAVFTRIFENLIPGAYSMLWDGSTNNGVDAASGIYFCTMKTDCFSKSTKMVMLK